MHHCCFPERRDPETPLSLSDHARRDCFGVCPDSVVRFCVPQASESGSIDELQSHVLEWQEMVSMVTEAEAARDQAREEKSVMALRMSHIEEEREGKERPWG